MTLKESDKGLETMTYRLQTKPDESVRLHGGATVRPVATLKDEYGVSHIIIDDHCYVLINGSVERGFGMVKHWFKEAVAALQKLPTDPRELEPPIESVPKKPT